MHCRPFPLSRSMSKFWLTMRRCLRSYLEDQQKFVAHAMVSCFSDISSSLGDTCRKCRAVKNFTTALPAYTYTSGWQAAPWTNCRMRRCCTSHNISTHHQTWCLSVRATGGFGRICCQKFMKLSFARCGHMPVS